LSLTTLAVTTLAMAMPGRFLTKEAFSHTSNALFPLPEDSEEVHYITFPIYFFYVKVIY